MKQLLTIAAILLIASCGSKSKPKEKFVSHSDTTKINGVYIDFSDSLKIKSGVVFEVVRDAIDVDSVLKVNQVKDSIFFYKPAKDTTGQWRLILRPYICTERNLDTCINRLSRIVDTLKIKLNKNIKK